MNIVQASTELLYPSHQEAREGLLRLELAGRTCYKSEDKVSEDSAPKFAKMVLGRGHESVIEHLTASFKIICDRGVSHEIVRHRLASYSQESTRYVNYAKRLGISFIDPRPAFPMAYGEYFTWELAMKVCESQYNALIEMGMPPEMARDVLPTSLKTELVMTANVREWRHFCKLRCSPKAHPQMREIAKPILSALNMLWPEIFGDIAEEFLG